MLGDRTEGRPFMGNKGNLRVLNSSGQRAEAKDVPWTKILLGTGAIVIASTVGVELFRHFVLKPKQEANPVPQLPPAPLQTQLQSGPMFSPYPQFQQFSGYPQNPMAMPAPSDDAEPKWFARFKEEQNRRLSSLEKPAKPAKKKRGRKPRLEVVDDDDTQDTEDDYEEEVA